MDRKTAEELKEFHEAEAAKIRAAITNAQAEQQTYLKSVLKMHEDKIIAITKPKG